MKQKLLPFTLIALVVALTLNLNQHFEVQEDQLTASKVQAQFAQLPLAFEPNVGQAGSVVQYLVHHGQATTYFVGTDTITTVGSDQLTMRLAGATLPAFTGTDELSSKTNYFFGSDQSKWQTGVANFQTIIAKNVYPGIDLKYYGSDGQLEHDFIVSPDTDPAQIGLEFAGHKELMLDASGNLTLKLANTELTLEAPVSYQETAAGGRKAVTSSFEVEGKKVRIAMGDYDTTRPLVIDPTLIYSTYLGGSSDEFGRKIAIDSSGNAYIGGQTTSSDFPTSSPYQGTFGGTEDAFVTKLNAAGTALIYSTYVGGTGTDQAIGLTIDSSGNAYIVGNTDSTDYPTASPYQAANGGTQDVFVTKLDSTGSSLVFSTYIGGSIGENGRMIAVDSSDNVYITGSTQSSDYPTASPFQATNAGSPNADAFLTKFDSSGSSLVYSTYLGGLGSDNGDGLAVDASDNPYIIGYTDSTDFPTSSPYQAANAGDNDVFVAKFDSSGSSLTFSTYIGGTGTDFARGMTLDSSDNIYLTGLTNSTDYPTSSAIQPFNVGGYDAFVTKVDSSGASLTWSSYIGGSADDQGLAITLDTSDQVYVVGLTGSSNFPSVLPYQAVKGTGDDVFVAKLNAAGSGFLYSTFVGGNGTDIAFGVDIGTNGNAYITGFTDSTDFPTLTPYQASNAGGIDTFVLQLADSPVVVTGVAIPVLAFIIGSTTCDLGIFSATETQFCTHTIAAASNASGGYVISYIPTTTLTSGANTITAMAAQTTSVLASEQFGLNLKANTAAGSFTATDFGAEASGGTGTAMTGYELANQFKFDITGDDIAQTAGPSNLTTFTASYIANITAISEAGLYATPVTYNIVASY